MLKETDASAVQTTEFGEKPGKRFGLRTMSYKHFAFLRPLAIAVVAIVSAGVMAYGTHPQMARYVHGIDYIIFTRRVEWLLAAASLTLCVMLLALVIGVKHSAWWLVALVPVLALFVHRYASHPEHEMRVLEEPQFVEASDRLAPIASDWVVGIVFEHQAYAFPYKALYRTPVIEITDYDQRILLMWSAGANKATAFKLAREMRVRDLEIVTEPADALLLYDKRLGQFIISVTGTTHDGKRPVGFGSPIRTSRTTWADWVKDNKETKVLVAANDDFVAPPRPIVPQSAVVKERYATEAEFPITVIACTQPAAVASGMTIQPPLNTTSGETRLLVMTDPVTSELKAFDRRVNEDLFPTFKPYRNFKTPNAALIDSDSGSLWDTSGLCVEGPFKGQKLRKVETESDLYWGVMKFWIPGLERIANQ